MHIFMHPGVLAIWTQIAAPPLSTKMDERDHSSNLRPFPAKPPVHRKACTHGFVFLCALCGGSARRVSRRDFLEGVIAGRRLDGSNGVEAP